MKSRSYCVMAILASTNVVNGITIYFLKWVGFNQPPTSSSSYIIQESVSYRRLVSYVARFKNTTSNTTKKSTIKASQLLAN